MPNDMSTPITWRAAAGEFLGRHRCRRPDPGSDRPRLGPARPGGPPPGPVPAEGQDTVGPVVRRGDPVEHRRDLVRLLVREARLISWPAPAAVNGPGRCPGSRSRRSASAPCSSVGSSAGVWCTRMWRYSVSRWAGIRPADRISQTRSCRLERCRAPAEEMTFSSSMIEPRSSAPMCSDEPADVLAGGEPRAPAGGRPLSKNSRADRDQPQVLQRRGLRPPLEVVVLRLVGPRDEGAEAAGAVLDVADHAQVLDALGVGLAGAHHHRGGGLRGPGRARSP